MKINKYIPLLGLGLLFTFSACNDYEDVPIDNFTDEYIFSPTDSLGLKAKRYLTYIYDIIPEGHNRVSFNGLFDDGDYLDAATDNAITSVLEENDTYRLAVGRYTSSSLIGTEMYWGNFYRGIRRANNVINNIDIVPLKETFNGGIKLNRAWKAEARFLRAYFYFELMKRYGGVPLIGDKLYDLGEDIQLPRNTFAECVDFIVDELDAIKDSLRTIPIANVDIDGHAVTQEAAMALKSRVLLYAASPLFNGQTVDMGNELVGYADYKAERWQQAAQAAKWFIDTYGPAGQKKFELSSDFRDVFLELYGGNAKEVIFFRQSGGNKGVGLEQKNAPVGYSGKNIARGRTSPTQNLVDAFPMLDGKKIDDPTSKYSYSVSRMYNNRDPRLDFTVFHNGSAWLNGQLETFGGGRSNPNSNTQKTKTGYYMRKFLGKFEDKNEFSDVYHRWVMFRYAEIMLNYAEAQNEFAGPGNEVYQVIKDLRKRAGIEEGDDQMYGLKPNMNKEEMRGIIQNERRIELAFEEHRYWDIRRWKIAEEIYKKPLQGVVIVKNATTYDYNFINVLDAPFDPKRYLYPIPYTEVIKNENMIQNPKW